jgi:hypothetical protein
LLFNYYICKAVYLLKIAGGPVQPAGGDGLRLPADRFAHGARLRSDTGRRERVLVIFF